MSNDKWFLSKNPPEDYLTVDIDSHQEDDPRGVRRFCANGKAPIAKVWIVDLSRGGVKVESDVVWSHHPPVDVVIHRLEDEDFKRLMCRNRKKEDFALGESDIPKYTPKQTGMLGKKFNG